MLKHVTVENLSALLVEAKSVLLDLRAEDAYLAEHIPDAQHLPREALSDFVVHTEKTTPLILYCYHGVSSCTVGNFLLNEGFLNVTSLDGGFSHWQTVNTDS